MSKVASGQVEVRSLYKHYARYLQHLLLLSDLSEARRQDLFLLLDDVQAIVKGAPYTDALVLSLVQVAGYLEGGVTRDMGETRTPDAPTGG